VPDEACVNPLTGNEDWQTHVSAASLLSFPTFSASSKPQQDLIDAVDFCLTQRRKVCGWRKQQLSTLRSVKASLVPVNVAIRAANPRDPDHPALRSAGRLDVALLATLCCAVDYPDLDLPYLMVHGFKVAGHCPDSGMHRPKDPLNSPEEAEAHLHHLMSSNAELVKDITKRMHAKARRAKTDAKVAADLAELYKVSAKEWTPDPNSGRSPSMSKGFTVTEMDEAFDGPGSWRPMERFLAQQETKARAIDDAKRSGVNATACLAETISLPSFTYPALVADLISRRLPQGMSMPDMTLGLDDLAAAYRQVPVGQDHLSVVAIWHPSLNDVRFHIVYGHAFGFAAAPANFSRMPMLLCTVARRFLACFTTSYLDDYITPALGSCGVSAQRGLAELHTLVGFPLEPEKRQVSGLHARVLGVECDMSRVHTDLVVVFTPRRTRCDKVIDLLRSCSTARRLAPSTASKIVGKLSFLLNGVYNKVGRASLGPFIARAHELRSGPFNKAMLHSASFVEQLIGHDVPLLPREVRLSAAARPPILLWTDAAGNGSLGFCIVDLEDPSRCFFEGGTVSDEIRVAMATIAGCDKDTLIAQWEALAGISALLTLPEIFRDRQVIHFIDNQGTAGAFSRGYSSAPDLAALSNVMHLTLAALHCDVWWEWLRSEHNPADLPSRPSADNFEALERAGFIWANCPLVLPSANDILCPRLRLPSST
jgi:hypothetical protein